MKTKPVGLAEYQCTKCGKTIEGKNGKKHLCCGVEMEKVWGGRGNSGGHDFRHQDK